MPIHESLKRNSKGIFIKWLDPIERFMTKVDLSEDGDCWEWQASLNKSGYGMFFNGPKWCLAHRWIFQQINGKIITPGAMVLHKCDNRRCVNPSHLYLGDAKNNSDDMRVRGRAAYPNGERHGCSKLNKNDVLTIRALAGKMSQNNMAVTFGVSQAQIWRIVNYQSWKHIY